MKDWISVETQLPDDNQKVFVTQVGKNGHDIDQYPERAWLASFHKNSGKFWANGGPLSITEIYGVVNWMPLPEAPA